jgi:hypothetical protein
MGHEFSLQTSARAVPCHHRLKSTFSAGSLRESTSSETRVPRVDIQVSKTPNYWQNCLKLDQKWFQQSLARFWEFCGRNQYSSWEKVSQWPKLFSRNPRVDSTIGIARCQESKEFLLQVSWKLVFCEMENRKQICMPSRWFGENFRSEIEGPGYPM